MRTRGWHGWMTASWLLAMGLAATGCGGGSKQAEEPVAAEPVADEDEASGGDVMIPGEKLDAIQSFFERKNRIVAVCFSDAMESGEIPKKTREVRVTVHLTITEQGRPTRLSFTDATVSSPTLESCLREHVVRWTLPTLPKPLDYSYTFGFSAL